MTRENVRSEVGKDKEIVSVIARIETCCGWYTPICDVKLKMVDHFFDSVWVRVVVRMSGETTERFAFGVW